LVTALVILLRSRNSRNPGAASIAGITVQICYW
jgi:hypothetical protein